jgi:hypothetical protein
MFKRSLVAVLVLMSMVTILVVAQSGAAGVPQDLQALTTVGQNGFAAIQSALSRIQNSLNSPTTAEHSTVRITPPVVVTSVPSRDVAICEVANVSATTQTIRSELIQPDGTVLRQTQIPLPAGQIAIGPFANGTRSPGLTVYCKFTVVDGSRTDIRGTLAVFNGSASDKLSVPAE